MKDDATKRPRSRGARLLFPEPQRRVPGERLVRTLLRTAHLASMAVLLGGHAFDVPAAQLRSPLAWTVATGLLLVLLEVHGTLGWLFEVRGLATLVKVGLVCVVPLAWDQRVGILMAVLAIGSVSSHMPARIRHVSLLTGRTSERRLG